MAEKLGLKLISLMENVPDEGKMLILLTLIVWFCLLVTGVMMFFSTTNGSREKQYARNQVGVAFVVLLGGVMVGYFAAEPAGVVLKILFAALNGVLALSLAGLTVLGVLIVFLGDKVTQKKAK